MIFHRVLASVLLALTFAACSSKVNVTKSTSSSEVGESSTPQPLPMPSPSGVRRSCTLSSGDVIADGSTKQVYQRANGDCINSCASISAIATCSDGVLTGADPSLFSHTSCTAPTNCSPCVLPCGQTVQTGGYGVCFNASKPSACGATCAPNLKRFNCNNGTLTNIDSSAVSSADRSAYVYSSCDSNKACKDCKTSNGTKVPDGQSTAFFKNGTVACGQSCFSGGNQVMLMCSNGVFSNASLYPDFIYSSCTASCSGNGGTAGTGGGAPASMCPFPWGSGVATDGTRVVAFKKRSVACGDSCAKHKAVIKCNGLRGLWSGGGTYIYNTCYETCP